MEFKSFFPNNSCSFSHKNIPGQGSLENGLPLSPDKNYVLLVRTSDG